jgi:hypothetical protein
MNVFRRLNRTQNQAEPARDVVVIRREMNPAYYAFLQTFAKAQGIDVVLDPRADGDDQRQPSGVATTIVAPRRLFN